MLERFLIFWFFLIIILAQTDFNYTQQFLELLLIIFFILYFTFSPNKIVYKNNFYLVSIFLIASAFSLFLNDIFTFLLNFKIYFLSISTFIFFRNRIVNSRIIKGIIYLNLIFLVFEILFKFYPLPIKNLNFKFSGLIGSRPLGLFLNTHLSAYVFAIYIIYKINSKKSFFYSIFLSYNLFSFGSKFTFLSFILQIIDRKSKFIIYLLCLQFIFLVFIYFNVELKNYIFEQIPMSGRFIMEQILDPNTYLDSFSIFPTDYLGHLHSQIVTNSKDELFSIKGNEIGNEIQLITLIMEGGIILCFVYLFFLLRKLKYFRIFIIISLLHYASVTSPLIIFLMLNYQNILNKQKQ
jgi:hypothetical protein